LAGISHSVSVLDSCPSLRRKVFGFRNIFLTPANSTGSSKSLREFVPFFWFCIEIVYLTYGKERRLSQEFPGSFARLCKMLFGNLIFELVYCVVCFLVYLLKDIPGRCYLKCRFFNTVTRMFDFKLCTCSLERSKSIYII
jgi:hypothetical protein